MAVPKGFCFVPAKDFVLRQRGTIPHHSFMFYTDFFIYVITDHQIQGLRAANTAFQGFQYFYVCLLIQPVIAVHHFKIQPCGMNQSCIDSTAVSFIFLVNSADNAGICSLILLCNLQCIIFWAVIHHNNFYFISSHQKRIDAFSHIFLRIITWYSNT